jgi:hypothetical protein
MCWPCVGRFRDRQRGGSCPSTGRISWPSSPRRDQEHPLPSSRAPGDRRGLRNRRHWDQGLRPCRRHHQLQLPAHLSGAVPAGPPSERQVPLQRRPACGGHLVELTIAARSTSIVRPQDRRHLGRRRLSRPFPLRAQRDASCARQGSGLVKVRGLDPGSDPTAVTGRVCILCEAWSRRPRRSGLPGHCLITLSAGALRQRLRAAPFWRAGFLSPLWRQNREPFPPLRGPHPL